jgi:hypothetical protein
VVLDNLIAPDCFRRVLSYVGRFSANLRVAAALAERGYDLRLVVGEGGHDANHAGAILPDALRWLWSEGPQASLGSR